MSSNIPTLSARKPGTSQSRLLAPSTTTKKLTFPIRNATAVSSQKLTQQQSGLKRPSESTFGSQNKFKRITPLSLMRDKNVAKPVNSNQVTARLQFNKNFKTPIASRREPPLSAVENATVDNKIVNMQMLLKVPTEDKGTSPIVDRTTKDTEINSYKCKILILEKQIDDMTLKNSRIRIENELKETKMKSDFDANQRIIKELTKELTTSKGEREKLRGELERYQEECLQQTDAFEKQQMEYEKSIYELREEVMQAKSSESDTRSTLASENLLLKHRISELENELEKSNGELQIYYSNMNELKSKECDTDRLKKDLNSANLEIQRLSDQVESFKESAHMNDILKGEINHYQQVQEENCHLKNQLDLLNAVREKNLILKEQLNSYEEQIETLNQLVNQKNVDLGELSYNRKRINEWIKIVGADAPDIVVSQISELKQSAMLLRMENDSLKVDLKNKSADDSFKDFSSKSLELKLNELKQEITQLSSTLKKLNRKCLLLEKQRDSYKKVLDFYESEVTINFDDVDKKRISQLEDIIEDYKSLLQSQEEDLKQAQAVATQMAAKEKEVHELKSEIERIRALNPHVCTSMSLDVSTLQTREKNFRVIHLKENPLTVKINEYNQEFNRLNEENTRLKCLVEVIESGNGADMTRQINEAIQHRSDVEKWKKSFETLDKRYNDLREKFKQISKSFRETCYYLTGYKIDNIADKRYKLSHVYDQQKRNLIFELNKSEIRMLEGSSLDSLKDKIDTYLTKGNSYPAFLAAFTLELFQNTTNLSRSFMST